jgi:hypothetical protein
MKTPQVSFLYIYIYNFLFKFLVNYFIVCIILVPRSHIDDEYAKATERDPKILLTTSRDPSAPLTQFVKVIC